MASSGVGRHAYAFAIGVYRLLPEKFSDWLARFVAPSFAVGTSPFVSRADGRLLLVRHSYKDGWSTPGGFVDRKEPAGAGAIREAWEETGLRIELVGEPAVVVDEVGRHVEYVIRAVPADGADPDAVTPSSPEIVEVAWFDPGDLPALHQHTARALAALVRAELWRER
jgi:ADP-ribose pyrophosphatase YjhB (NUDIX family)